MNNLKSLFDAIQANEEERVLEIVAAKPNLLGMRDRKGVSPVLWAAYCNSKDMVSLLLDLGASLDIFEAAATGKSLKASEIIKNQPESVNSYAPDGFTPLCLAAYFGHQTVLEILLTHGADVNLPSNNASQVRPLHLAAANRHIAIAEALIKAGAQIDARQAGGFTPLHAAAGNGQIEMVDLLLRSGADRSLAADDGRDALAFAAGGGSALVIARLKQPG
jgi:ankyrin repeat protein